MAEMPTMGGVSGSPVRPPNATLKNGDPHGSYPQGHKANEMVTPPNAAGDRRGGSSPLAGHASPVHPPNREKGFTRGHCG